MKRILLFGIMCDEGPHLLEWIAHHKRIGFTDIIIAENNSDDGTREALQILDQMGIVQYIDNSEIQLENPGKRPYQLQLNIKLPHISMYQNADWAMMLDTDEFLNVKIGDGFVTDLIEQFDNRPHAISLQWCHFGSTQRAKISERLTTERFTACENFKDPPTKRTFKTIFKPKYFQRPKIHFPHKPRNTNLIYLDGSGNLLDAETESKHRLIDPDCAKFAQINHYKIRDLTSFLANVLRGRNPQFPRNYDLNYWKSADKGKVIDETLAKMAPQTRAIMNELNAQSDGVLYELRNYAIQHKNSMVEKILKTDKSLRELKSSIEKYWRENPINMPN